RSRPARLWSWSVHRAAASRRWCSRACCRPYAGSATPRCGTSHGFVRELPPRRALARAFETVRREAGRAAEDSYLENEAAAYRGGDAGKLRRVIDDRLD